MKTVKDTVRKSLSSVIIVKPVYQKVSLFGVPPYLETFDCKNPVTIVIYCYDDVSLYLTQFTKSK